MTSAGWRPIQSDLSEGFNIPRSHHHQLISLSQIKNADKNQLAQIARHNAQVLRQINRKTPNVQHSPNYSGIKYNHIKTQKQPLQKPVLVYGNVQQTPSAQQHPVLGKLQAHLALAQRRPAAPTADTPKASPSQKEESYVLPGLGFTIDQSQNTVFSLDDEYTRHLVPPAPPRYNKHQDGSIYRGHVSAKIPEPIIYQPGSLHHTIKYNIVPAQQQKYKYEGVLHSLPETTPLPDRLLVQQQPSSHIQYLGHPFAFTTEPELRGPVTFYSERQPDIVITAAGNSGVFRPQQETIYGKHHITPDTTLPPPTPTRISNFGSPLGGFQPGFNIFNSAKDFYYAHDPSEPSPNFHSTVAAVTEPQVITWTVNATTKEPSRPREPDFIHNPVNKYNHNHKYTNMLRSTTRPSIFSFEDPDEKPFLPTPIAAQDIELKKPQEIVKTQTVKSIELELFTRRPVSTTVQTLYHEYTPSPTALANEVQNNDMQIGEYATIAPTPRTKTKHRRRRPRPPTTTAATDKIQPVKDFIKHRTREKFPPRSRFPTPLTTLPSYTINENLSSDTQEQQSVADSTKISYTKQSFVKDEPKLAINTIVPLLTTKYEEVRDATTIDAVATQISIISEEPKKDPSTDAVQTYESITDFFPTTLPTTITNTRSKIRYTVPDVIIEKQNTVEPNTIKEDNINPTEINNIIYNISTEATTVKPLRTRPVANKFDTWTRPRFSIKDHKRLNTHSSSTTVAPIVHSTVTSKLRFPSRQRVKVSPRPVIFSQDKSNDRAVPTPTEIVTKVQDNRFINAPKLTELDAVTTTEQPRKKFTPKDPRHRGDIKRGNQRKTFNRVTSTTEISLSTSKPAVSRNISSALRRPHPSIRTRFPIKPLREEITTTEGPELTTLIETPLIPDSKFEVTTASNKAETSIMKIANTKFKTTSNTVSGNEMTSPSDQSKRVSELTLSASMDYNNPGIFKSISTSSRRVPGYFTIATEDPILPIEAFFPKIKNFDDEK